MTQLKFADSISRLGTESAFTVLAKANELAANGKDIINLGIGQPDFRTPDHIVKAGIKALEDGHHGYTPANGIPELREAVASDLERRHQTSVNPNNIIVVPGGKPTMFFAVLLFGEKGAEIMYPNPGFPIYESVINYTGATPIPIALKEENGFAFDAESVLSQITKRTRLIIINSPANPTGGVTPKSEVDKLVIGLKDYPNVAILSDEIYSQMLYNGRKHVSLLQYPEIRDRLIVLDGWSKTYAMTGWRIGYAAGPENIIKAMSKIQGQATSCANSIGQKASIEALLGDQNCVEEMKASFLQRRDLIVRLLNDLPGVQCAVPNGAFYVFPDFSSYLNRKGNGKLLKDTFDISEYILDSVQVVTVPGDGFGSSEHIRFSYATNRKIIQKGMDRVKKALEMIEE